MPTNAQIMNMLGKPWSRLIYGASPVYIWCWRVNIRAAGFLLGTQGMEASLILSWIFLLSNVYRSEVPSERPTSPLLKLKMPTSSVINTQRAARVFFLFHFHFIFHSLSSIYLPRLESILTESKDIGSQAPPTAFLPRRERSMENCACSRHSLWDETGHQDGFCPLSG